MSAQAVWREDAHGNKVCSTDPTETFGDPDGCCMIDDTPSIPPGGWPSFECPNIKCANECELDVREIEWGSDGHCTAIRVKCYCPEVAGGNG